MKKTLTAFGMAFFIVFGLCGCQQNNPKENTKYTTIVMTIDCSDDIYGIGFEYCMNRKMLGGQVLQSDPEMRLPLENKDFYICFDERGFSSPEQLQNGTFGIIVYLVLENNIEIPMEYLYEWSAEFGREYRFTLSGNLEGGFSFTPVASDTQYTVTPIDALPDDIA